MHMCRNEFLSSLHGSKDGLFIHQVWFEARTDPAGRQKLFRKETSKISQLEEGKGAEIRGIISRTGEKPPAAAEIEMVPSGVVTGKGI